MLLSCASLYETGDAKIVDSKHYDLDLQLIELTIHLRGENEDVCILA